MNTIENHIIESINKMEELLMSLANQESLFPKHNEPIREWMTLADAAKYAGVSNNTFSKFRLLGLKVSHVEGIKRVSRTEVDNFLEKNSY